MYSRQGISHSSIARSAASLTCFKTYILGYERVGRPRKGTSPCPGLKNRHSSKNARALAFDTLEYGRLDRLKTARTLAGTTHSVHVQQKMGSDIACHPKPYPVPHRSHHTHNAAAATQMPDAVSNQAPLPKLPPYLHSILVSSSCHRCSQPQLCRLPCSHAGRG